MQQQLSDGTARTYLMCLLPYFTYLTTDEWRKQREDQWNSRPDAVQESVRDYLVYRLGCKVQPKSTYAYVKLTAQSPSTVRLFLAALKQFYAVMIREGYYSHSNPLLDVTSRLLREIEREESGGRHRMPQSSGVEEPTTNHFSANFFRLAHDQWEVQPVDDPELGKKLVGGFAPANLCLRDQIVVRLILETGARIREVLRLTVGDWRARGCNQEARACSKGSRGRRVKTLRFSSTTARMLRQYLNTDRLQLDLEQRRLDQLSDADPLFLSQRRKSYDYEAFKRHWYKLCKTVGLDLNVHALRHWYTTQSMRLIAEEAKSSAEITLRKEALVRYMAWRNPETLRTYENYFKGIQHYAIADQVHQRLEKDTTTYVKHSKKKSQQAESQQLERASIASVHEQVSESSIKKTTSSNGWAKLLALGGAC